MIRTERGMVTVSGTSEEVVADMCTIVRTIYEEVIVNEFGVEDAPKVMADMLEIALGIKEV